MPAASASDAGSVGAESTSSSILYGEELGARCRAGDLLERRAGDWQQGGQQGCVCVCAGKANTRAVLTLDLRPGLLLRPRRPGLFDLAIVLEADPSRERQQQEQT